MRLKFVLERGAGLTAARPSVAGAIFLPGLTPDLGQLHRQLTRATREAVDFDVVVFVPASHAADFGGARTGELAVASELAIRGFVAALTVPAGDCGWWAVPGKPLHAYGWHITTLGHSTPPANAWRLNGILAWNTRTTIPEADDLVVGASPSSPLAFWHAWPERLALVDAQP